MIPRLYLLYLSKDTKVLPCILVITLLFLVSMPTNITLVTFVRILRLDLIFLRKDNEVIPGILQSIHK